MAENACSSLLRGGRTSCAEPTMMPSCRARNIVRSGTSSTPLKYRSSAMPPGRVHPAEPAAIDDGGVGRLAQRRQVVVIELGGALHRHAGPAGGRPRPRYRSCSWCPAQEIAQDAQADLLAFFDVELGAGAIAARHHGDHLAAVLGGGDTSRPARRRPARSCARNRRDRPAAARPARDARPVRTPGRSSPSAAGAARARGPCRRFRRGPSRSPASPRAPARARPSAACRRRCPGTACRPPPPPAPRRAARHGGQTRGAIGEGALAGQHDAVGAAPPHRDRRSP